ncbi:MAG: phage terminase large subunit [Alphaproteobacteria bacterium]|nr:phage terminase large subunit [Alphaproteobacteria bacterium]
MAKHDITNADFKLFLVLWNQRMGLKTPIIHKGMANWLEEAWRRGDTRLLLMAFRSCGKSTIVGVFAAWLLYRDPNLRILVLAADEALAGKMVRNVKRIIERHPLTPAMKPKNADQWAGDRFTVRRMLELRDPSMLARGVSANITGSRADVIICDDVEVPNTADSAEKRHDLRTRLTETAFVLAPGGTQIYVGTPHTYFSIYADAPRTELGEGAPFLDGYRRLEIPLIDKTGESAWPERFSRADIERLKVSAGPNKFTSQMLLRPVNIAEGRLRPALLNFYDSSMAYIKELNRLEISGREMVSASAWWDPAFGNGDGSVLAAVFTDAEGFYWLHKLAYLKLDPLSALDEATQQCQQVAMIAQFLRLPSISLETNGVGNFLPAILKHELARKKVRCAVREIHNRRPKDVRILEAFDAVLAARALYANESIKATPFLQEMAEWNPGGRNRDDGLDAVAGALSQEPVRIARAYTAGGQDWMKGAKPQRAETDFGV